MILSSPERWSCCSPQKQHILTGFTVLAYPPTPPPPPTTLILIFSHWVVNKTVLVTHTQLTLISMRAAQHYAPGCISREMLLWKTAGINKDLLQFSLYSSVAPRDGWNAACGRPGLVRFTQNLLFHRFMCTLTQLTCLFLNKQTTLPVFIWSFCERLEGLWEDTLVLHRTKNLTDLHPATESILPEPTEIKLLAAVDPNKSIRSGEAIKILQKKNGLDRRSLM